MNEILWIRTESSGMLKIKPSIFLHHFSLALTIPDYPDRLHVYYDFYKDATGKTFHPYFKLPHELIVKVSHMC